MKKSILTLLLAITALYISAQTHQNSKKGIAIQGYDVVSYFMSNTPTKGNSNYVATYNNLKYKFSSQENLEAFKNDPETYTPQYGGYCAYAIGENLSLIHI